MAQVDTSVPVRGLPVSGETLTTDATHPRALTTPCFEVTEERRVVIKL
jgi:hypothetical protein